MALAQDINQSIIAWFSENPRDLLPIEVWAEINRRKQGTIRSWIFRKNIVEGIHCFKDPNGSWWISCSAMDDWVKSGPRSANDSEIIKEARPKPGRKPKITTRSKNAPRL